VSSGEAWRRVSTSGQESASASDLEAFAQVSHGPKRNPRAERLTQLQPRWRSVVSARFGRLPSPAMTGYATQAIPFGARALEGADRQSGKQPQTCRAQISQSGSM
jgi:hypothetical protein